MITNLHADKYTLLTTICNWSLRIVNFNTLSDDVFLRTFQQEQSRNQNRIQQTLFTPLTNDSLTYCMSVFKCQQRQSVCMCRLFGENGQLHHKNVHIRLTENVVDGVTDLLLAVLVARDHQNKFHDIVVGIGQVTSYCEVVRQIKQRYPSHR